MSFLSSNQSPANKKIVLVEIDIPQIQRVWINYEAGIWFYKFNWSGITVTGSDGLIGYYSDEVPEINNIGSMKVEATNFIKVSVLAELRAQEGSFYWDRGTQTVYAHFVDWHHPLSKIISVGLTSGFSTSARFDENGRPLDSYFNDIYYRPCVRSIPAISKRKDPLFFGIMMFQGASITLDNQDGYFGDYVDNKIFGQPIKVLYGVDDIIYDEYETIFSGFVEKVTIDYTKFTIQIQDARKFLSRKIPINRFEKSDYPNLSDDSVNIVKPIAYGVVRDAPCICTNEDEVTPANYTFMFMDTEFHTAVEFTQAYAEGEKKAVVSSDLAAGTFVLSNANYDPGQEVTADFTGASTDNALDVLKDVLLNYGDVAYIDTNYDRGEWNYETGLAPDIYLWVGDGKEETISEIILAVCKSVNGAFLVTNEGKYTFRTYNKDKVILKTIEDYEWLNAPQISYDSTKYLTSARAKYNQKISTDRYRIYTNLSQEGDILEDYQQYRQKDFETLLVSESDAEDFTDEILDLSNTVWPIVRRKTKLQNIDVDIMNFIIANHARPGREAKKAVYEVIGYSRNMTLGEVHLEMRYVRDYQETEYDYEQGILYYEYIYGHKIHAVTEY